MNETRYWLSRDKDDGDDSIYDLWIRVKPDRSVTQKTRHTNDADYYYRNDPEIISREPSVEFPPDFITDNSDPGLVLEPGDLIEVEVRPVAGGISIVAMNETKITPPTIGDTRTRDPASPVPGKKIKD
ncbi:MAG: hypothetical protein IID32_06790 [Planctomycetes bacterium]|nr:hypothetical protein [Planctomycetota bacterium]